MPDGTGRRERKKVATRRAIADEALRLFAERGFDAVSVSEVADAADVARATLFAHFPTKEALVFDRDADHEARLVAAVTDREPGTSIPEALRRAFRSLLDDVAGDPRLAQHRALVASTPALTEHAHRMWLRHADALSAAIADDAGVHPDDAGCRALARFVLTVPSLATLDGDADDGAEIVDAAFALLENGWSVPAQAGASRAASVNSPARRPSRKHSTSNGV